MFKSRVITAFLMAAVFFASLFLLPWQGFAIFMGLVLLAGAWEWSNLSGFSSKWQQLLYCFFTLLLTLGVSHFTGLLSSAIDTEAVRTLLLFACGWWAVALLWVQGYPSSAILWGQRWTRAIVGWLVLIPAWLALAYLHRSPLGSWLILLVMFTVFVADTGAYFFGRAFGKHKLAKNVSPGKSWEGFFGGVLCCLVLALAVTSYAGFDSWLPILVIVVFTGLASVLGDLLESMVKRQRGIKDSGTLLPGHGGIMDRLDSITAAAPVFVLGIILSGWGGI